MEKKLDYLREILNSIEDMVFVFNQEGVFMDFMSADVDALHSPKEYFIGKSVREILPPSICDQVIEGIKALANTELSSYRFEYFLDAAWYSANLTRIKHQHADKSLILAVVRDISSGKANQILIEDLYRNANEGIILFQAIRSNEKKDYKFHLLTSNDEALRLLRFPIHNLSQKTLNELMPEKWQSHFQTLFCQVMENGIPVSDTINYSTDTEPIWLSFNISARNDGILVNIQDITEQVLLHEDLQTRNMILHELNQKKDDVLSILSHDLRSPIAGMISLLHLIKEGDNYTPLELSNYHDLLEENAINILVILDEMLSWSKASIRRDITPDLTLVNWFEELEWVKLGLSRFETKRIDIRNQLEKTMITYSNRGVVRSILRNLLTNALKFSYPDSVINVFSKTNQESIQLTVEDFGVGMDEDMMNKLINSGSPKSTAGTLGEKGTGMGIEIIKRFVESNKGHIQIESELKKFTRFSLFIPVVR